MSEEIPFVTDMITGYFKSQIVRTLATLSIADWLAKGPASLGHLVEKTGADADGLERLLRAAVTLGFVVYAEGQYCATARLEVLREDAPVSLKYWRSVWPALGSGGLGVVSLRPSRQGPFSPRRPWAYHYSSILQQTRRKPRISCGSCRRQLNPCRRRFCALWI